MSATIGTDQIAALREKTGAGMMDCKRALTEAGGDLEKAQEILRKKGLADAAKKSSRATKEGLIYAHLSPSGDKAALIEINCETDFVARTDDFKALAAEVSKRVAEGSATDSDLDGLVKGAIAKLGENIGLRRKAALALQGAGRLEPYVHTGNKAGSLVELGCGKPESAKRPEFLELAKELALQIVGASPKWTSREEVPADVVEKEKDIAVEQLKKEGKPEAQFPKIIPGKLEKFYSIWCLVDQPSIRDASGKTKVKSLLEGASTKLGDKISVRRFVRYQLGGE